MKILFITSNRVGDAVLSTGVLAWLVEKYPGAQFTIACGPYAAGLFRAVPRLDRLIVLEKKTWNRHWLELWQACIGTHWDIVVDLRNSIVSRLLRTQQRAAASGSTGKHKVIENAAVLSAVSLSRIAGEGAARLRAAGEGSSAKSETSRKLQTLPPLHATHASECMGHLPSPAMREEETVLPHPTSGSIPQPKKKPRNFCPPPAPSSPSAPPPIGRASNGRLSASPNWQKNSPPVMDFYRTRPW